jgi:HPt (histidine-containing phosphotransfer) domain-containing protein
MKSADAKRIAKPDVKSLLHTVRFMAYEPGAIDAALAAAVGDEPMLIAELRVAFLDSVRRGLQVLEGATDEAEWKSAACRLRGLAASFGAVRLMALASEAADSDLQDPALMRRLRRTVERL